MPEHVQDTAAGGAPPAVAGRRSRGAPAAAVAVGLLTAGLLAGCGTDPEPAAAAGSPDCPRTVTARLAGGEQPQRHDEYLADVSDSGAATMAELGPQIEALVTDAVAGRASLTVSVVGASATDLTTVLDCPALVPLVNDEDAREQATANLVTAVTDAVVEAYPERDMRHGSDLYGALIAVSGRLPAGVPARIVATSDGMNVGRTDLPLSLPGVTVELYGVGRLAGNGLDSAAATQLRDAWSLVLTQAGATPVVRFTPYVAGQVTP
ncbi:MULTISPECIES: hypothetical protein [unclassified Blastococcus]